MGEPIIRLVMVRYVSYRSYILPTYPSIFWPPENYQSFSQNAKETTSDLCGHCYAAIASFPEKSCSAAS